MIVENYKVDTWGEKMRAKRPLKWIIETSKPQRLSMAILILSNAFFSVLSIIFAFLIKEIIDSAIPPMQDLNRLISFAVAIIVVVLVQFVFRLITNGLAERIKAKLEIAYKTRLFNNILSKEQDKITAYHSGELINRLTSDVAIVSDGISSIVPTVVSAFTRLICAIVALIILDWIFAIAFTVAGLLVFLVITCLRGMLKNLHKGVQETDGKVRSFMQECIENLLAVKVFSAGGKVQQKSNDLQEKNFKIKMRRKNYSVSGHALYNFIFSAGYLFALIYGGVKILDGIISYGALSAILQLVNNVQVPFASLSNVLPKYYAMIASAERIIEIENVEQEPQEPCVNANELYKSTNAIVFDNVSFSYDRDVVLNGASARVNRGDFVAIIGGSGQGKSTLFKLMLGVYRLDEGEIYCQTEQGKVKLSVGTRPLFAYVPQGNMLFSGTIRDNVTFINQTASESQIESALEISCASEFIQALPKRLDTIVGEHGVGLSEGQVQRIAIARAILANAPILLLDEATSALDEKTEKKVLENLAGLKGVTKILISHKKQALSMCDGCLEIKDGKIIKKQ